MNKRAYGGQALIEGVMMRGKNTQAMAVRQDDGTIVSDVQQITTWQEKWPILSKPFIRGTASLFESLKDGMKALTWSTNASLGGGEEPEELTPLQMGLTIALSMVLGIGLFFILPVALAHFMQGVAPGNFLQNILEGFIRVGIFLLYLYLITRLKDIRRVFQYHGAEHKTIHCYEADLPLTPENAQKFPTLHPRCGTSFLFLVMVISIFVFALVGVDNIALRFASRLFLLPVVAGISYEVLRFCGKHMDKKWVRAIAWPGMQLQHLTTAPPDDEMLEVAIYSLQKVRAVEEDPVLDPEYEPLQEVEEAADRLATNQKAWV